MTARVLGLPFHAIEVDVKRLGGGFGGKEDQATPYAVLAALAAHRLGRPVELVLRRDEDIERTGKRHPYRSEFKIGLDGDGHLVAFEARHYQNSGAAADLSLPVLARTLFHGTNAYRVPNVRLFGVCCRTHLPPNTAFRGFGGPQGMFVIESALARAAEVMGVSREELQRKNLVRDGDLFPYGQQVLEGRAERTWDEAAELYDFAERRRRVAGFNRENRRYKKGLAVMPICFGISFTATFMNQAGSLVHVYTDGSVGVATGGVEMGQGVSTNIALVVARTFGIHPRRVKVESTNTTRVANMSASAASATTLLNGNAALLACQQILGRLKEMVARELGLPDAESLTLVDEQVLVDGHRTGWSWERMVRSAYLERLPLSAHAHFATPNIWYDEERETGRPFAYHVFGTALHEVTLDVLRGTYRIDSVKILHDLGRPLVETVDRGQIEGGLAQGLGWMTLEDLRFGTDGRCLSGALATYKVPDVDFMPEDLEVRYLENAGNPLGPFHSKAVGEPPLMYGIGVFFALRDALRAARPDKELAFAAPLTPERALLELWGDTFRFEPLRGEVAAVAD
jgi:xanthine dehydrogenase large subunit